MTGPVTRPGAGRGTQGGDHSRGPSGDPCREGVQAGPAGVAAGEAVAEALRGVPGVTSVRGVVEHGAVVAVVGLAEGADEPPVKETLDRFSISWRAESDPPVGR